MNRPISLDHPDYRFELRPCDISHVPEQYQAAAESKAHVQPWMAWLHDDYAVRDAEKWAAHCVQAWGDGTEYNFLIYDRTDGEVAGSCGLNEMKGKDLVCNLGYWVRTSKLRLGAATQAIALLQAWAFSELKLNRLEIVVAEGNQASRAVAEKAEALYEGRQRCRTRVGEKVFDSHMYALIRPELVTDSSTSRADGV